jgi:hypothetical protein
MLRLFGICLRQVTSLRSQDRSVGIATASGRTTEKRGSTFVHIDSGARPASYPMDTEGSFPGSVRGVKVTTHLYLVSRLVIMKLCFHSPTRLHGVVLIQWQVNIALLVCDYHLVSWVQRLRKFLGHGSFALNCWKKIVYQVSLSLGGLVIVEPPHRYWYCDFIIHFVFNSYYLQSAKYCPAICRWRLFACAWGEERLHLCGGEASILFRHRQ